MNTTENNRLLAEFVGWELKHNPNISQKTWNNKEEGYCRDKDSTFIEYSNNWNLLMKVVEKIFGEECFKPLAGEGMYYLLRINIEKALKKAKIEAVYNACLEFVKWYNENVKSAEKK